MKTVIIRIGSEEEKWLPKIVIFVLMVESVKIVCFVSESQNPKTVSRCISEKKTMNHTSASIAMSAMQSFILKTVPTVVSVIFVLRVWDARIVSDV